MLGSKQGELGKSIFFVPGLSQKYRNDPSTLKPANLGISSSSRRHRETRERGRHGTCLAVGGARRGCTRPGSCATISFVGRAGRHAVTTGFSGFNFQKRGRCAHQPQDYC